LSSIDILNDSKEDIKLHRFDRLQSRYLTTGDFSALQQMETEYPMETRVLIEKVLRIGMIDDPDISQRILSYFQDSTLQALVNDAENEFINTEDINKQLQKVFSKLKKELPDIKIPRFYTQIGALDESVVVGNDMIGISLDKYMGANYPLYKKHYSWEERTTMSRRYIVPDCVCFYLMSLYPLENFESRTQQERDFHMGKMMWICNYLMEEHFFDLDILKDIETFQEIHHLSVPQLLVTSKE